MSNPVKTLISTQTTSVTGTLQRTVADSIRSLNPVITPFLANVATTDEMGNYSEGKGLIAKEKTDTMRFEWFTFLPITLTDTVVSGTSTTCVVASTTKYTAGTKIMNTKDMSVFIVAAVESDTTTLTGAKLGSTTWNPAVGDKLLILGNAWPEGSTSGDPLMKDVDNNLNYCDITRNFTELANTAINTPHYGGDIRKRYKKQSMDLTLRQIENDILFSKGPASGETTTITTWGTVYHKRGIWDFAAVPVPMGGAASYEKFSTTIYNAMPESMALDKVYWLLLGRARYNSMLQWANQRQTMIDTKGEVDKFGIVVKRFQVGNVLIEPKLCNAFDQAGMTDKALVVDPDDMKYRFKTGFDLQIKMGPNGKGIQANDKDSIKEEIYGVIGLQVWTGGANVLAISGWTN